MLSRSNSLRRARPLLGTLVEIAAIGADADLTASVDAAFSAIERVQKLMSFHDEHSDVSRLNAAGEGCDIHVDPQTYRVVERAIELGELSGGAFDIATAPALVERGFLPTSSRGPMPACGATYRDIELGAGYRIRWRRKGWIDLGGIAKGFAVDCAIAALQAHGVPSGIVNAGGDLRCFGERQPIHVRRPVAPTELIALGWLCDGAIATSGGYFVGIQSGGRQIDPLVDPRRNVCIGWDDSVSVVASDCMTADALTKIVRLTRQDVHVLLERMGAQAVVIDKEMVGSCGTPLLQQEEIA